jgi:hypothetical protein
MQSFALDSNMDLTFSDNGFALITESEEVAQNITTLLQFFLREYFLDTSLGVPYLEKVFTKPIDMGNIESALKTAILTADGVDQLTTFNTIIDRQTRKLVVTFEVTTIFGDTVGGSASV